MLSQVAKSSSKRLAASALLRACDATLRALIEPLESRTLLSVTPLKPDHVVVVIESDRFAGALGDTANLPYVNQLAGSGLVLSSYQGVNPSTQSGEMNYLALFSGSTQGIIDNARGYSFTGPNLAQSLNSTTGFSFAGYSESLASDGSQDQQETDGVHSDLYTRNHNPMAMFTNEGPTQTNAMVNRTFADFKTLTAGNAFANLPTVSFVIPNNLDNTNGSNEAAPFATDTTAYPGLRLAADSWLKNNLDAYVQWAKTHNSLLLIVGNEGDRQRNFAAGTDTIIVGDPRLVVPGVDTTTYNHFNTLRTIEDMYGLTPLGSTATASDLGINAAGQLAAPSSLAATTTGLTSSANPSASGQAITFTATVTSTGVPAGIVTFMDGAATLGTGTLNGSGVATFSTSSLSIATHSITAVYAGNAGFSGSTSAVLSQVVNPVAAAASSTVVTPSVNPAKFGQSVTLTATVTPSGSGTPTGSVKFMDGAATLGTGTLNAAGVATFSTAALSAASHSITAIYSGDLNFNGSTSAALVEVVNQAATAAALVSSANPSVFGQSVSFTATIAATAPGAGTPTGSVKFMDGAATLGTGTLNAAGVATFSTAALSVASHSITAVYAGDLNFTGSTSAVLIEVVNQASTAAAIVSSANPSAFGQSVSFTATISATAPGAGKPTGTVTFMDGATSLGAGTLNASGVATLATSALSVATHSITVIYGGDTNFKTSTSAILSQVVRQASTTSTVTTSVNPAAVGQAINFTATVAVVLPGSGTPTGTVQFTIDGANTGSPIALSNGVATLTGISTLTTGNHTISAVYSGDVNFTASTAANLTQTVGAASIVRPSHIVVIVEEDRFANAIGDTASMPYVNSLAASGLVLSNFQGLNTSGQQGEMNYLGLYSGSTQGITDDGLNYSFNAANLASQLNSTPGLNFAGYSESLPSAGSQSPIASGSGTVNGTKYTVPDLYTRNHNPMAMFTQYGSTGSATTVNQTFAPFAALATQANTYANLPTVSIVIPNQLDETHGSNDSNPYATDPGEYVPLRKAADTWLQTNIAAYVAWAKANNSLLIITGDEGDRAHNFANGNQTIIVGDPRLVVPGTSTALMNSYNTLRTIEDMYGLTRLGNAATATDFPTNAAGQLAGPLSSPSAPTSVAATQGTLSDRVRLTWTASPGATGYQVYRSTTNNSATATLLNGTDVTGTLFDDLTAVSGTTYFYWVKADNAAGTSGFSAVASGSRP